jgi:muramoyltetrapeptide carboxypeptidase LdcA involved in peptidoglycan recycling
MPNLIVPPPLLSGDTIAIVSPSWGGAGAFPDRVQRGIQQIEALGFHAKVGLHALNQLDFASDTPEKRVADLHAAFADPDVRAIVAAIGGDHACHLLPLLDFDLIRCNPKIFMGFSDVTVLNIAIWKMTGLVTFNGPALLTDFAEFPAMFDYTREYMLAVLCGENPSMAIHPSTWWTEEFLDWVEKKYLERPRKRIPSPGWTWLKHGNAEGTLIGGCLESLDHLRGTPYWPDWEDAIFFLETSEEKPLPERVDSLLMDYENMGILSKLKGMLVGRPMYYEDIEKEKLRQVILERTRKYAFPIITDMDFGHTAPQFTLPVGFRARIDTLNQKFEIKRPARFHSV